jgi:hypothetical protein
MTRRSSAERGLLVGGGAVAGADLMAWTAEPAR